MPNLSLETLIAKFLAPMPDGADSGYAHYSDLALQIAERGQSGSDVLMGLRSTVDDDRLRAIIFALASHPVEPMRLRTLLVAYLGDQRPLIVAEAVDGLAALDTRDAIGQVLALQDHPSPYVRGSVLRFMARLYPH